MKFTATSVVFAAFALAARVSHVSAADGEHMDGMDSHSTEMNGEHSTEMNGEHNAEMMDQSADAAAFAYCVRPCTGTADEDPCGDGRGQQGFCTAVELEDPAAYGYGEGGSAVPATFLGCTADVCSSSCAGTNATVADDGTLCFPRKSTKDGMYMAKDDAELAAVARGCSGSHSMGEMVMVGTTHPTCAGTYSREGVPLGTQPEDEIEDDSEPGEEPMTSAASFGRSGPAAIVVTALAWFAVLAP